MTPRRRPASPLHPTGPTRRTDEAGDTLIEILITLVILSVTVVAMLMAFSTSISASSDYRTLSINDTVLRTVSEQVIAQFQQGATYVACPNGTPANYTTGYGGSTPLSSALVVPAPYASAGYSASITSVTYWNGITFDGTTATCGSAAVGADVPEQLTLTVDGPQGASESVAFVVEGNGQIYSTGATQLDAPTDVVLTTPASDSGGLVVSFSGSSNAPTTPTQYYTVTACTNAAMTLGCTPPSNQFASGGELTGLAPGTPYWVSIVANASLGYLASSAVTAGPQASSGTVSQPVVTAVSASATTAGALVVSFTAPTDAPGGDTDTGTACTDSAMTTGCVSTSGFASGSPITGLNPGSSYFVEVSANPDGSYPGATSLPFSPAQMATVQLTAPSGVSVASSTQQPGSLVVTFAAPSNAPSGQRYSVTGCTNQSMGTGCVTQSPYASGNQFAVLVPGSSYYVVVTALASSGYLTSTSAVPSSPAVATEQLTQPTVTKVSAVTNTPGALKVKYTGSSNAPHGVTYALTACTDTAMTLHCVSVANFSSNGEVTGLTSGVTYYVTVTANASPVYLASNPSAQASGTPN